ncbi:hypothetical protein BDW75DRAFT_202952 [Aspergillus navahoensis]
MAGSSTGLKLICYLLMPGAAGFHHTLTGFCSPLFILVCEIAGPGARTIWCKWLIYMHECYDNRRKGLEAWDRSGCYRKR